MFVLPSIRLRLAAESPPDALLAKLATLVAGSSSALVAPGKPFRGTIRGNRFKLVRVRRSLLGLDGGNGWQPVIHGEVVPTSTGAELRARIRLSLVGALFAATWLGACLFLLGTEAVALVAAPLASVPERGGMAPMVVATLLFGTVALGLMLAVEVGKARQLLCERLGCRPVGPNT